MQKAQVQMEEDKRHAEQREEALMPKQEILTPGATPRRTPSRIGL